MLTVLYDYIDSSLHSINRSNTTAAVALSADATLMRFILRILSISNMAFTAISSHYQLSQVVVGSKHYTVASAKPKAVGEKHNQLSPIQ